jgi:RNA polymerase sigma factor (sigma-70 family)
MNPLLAQRRNADRTFERIYKRHAADVYRYSLAVLRNPADAEDVTQTTFLNAYRAIQRGDRPEKAQNWLIAIAHNVCRQRFRQASRRPSEVAFDEDLAGAPPVESDAPSPEDLTRALSHLAFNQRAALVLRELEGRSYAEIAQALDISVSAVETLLFRARRALREQLEGSLTCHEAELAISRRLDSQLGRTEGGALRAHLRECKDCASFARSQRAQRSAWKALAAIPLPSGLAGFLGSGGGVAVTAGAGSTAAFGIGAKAVAVLTAAAVAGGVGYEGAKRVEFHGSKHHVAAAVPQRHVHAPRPAAAVPAPRPAVTPPPAPAPVVERPAVLPKPARAHPRPAAPSKHKQHPNRGKRKRPVVSGDEAAVRGKKESRPAPARAKNEQGQQQDRPGKAVGLARNERKARDRVKPERRAVGLARGEERAKQKAENAQPRGKKKAPRSKPVKHEQRAVTPPPPPAAPRGQGKGNGGGGGAGNSGGNRNGNGRGKGK